MPISPHVRALRAKVGHDLILLPSVTVMLFEQERLLLAQNADNGLWMTIGGAAEPDETPADAAETIALRFVTRAEVRDLPMTTLSAAIVEHAFDHNGTPYFAKPTWRPPQAMP